MNAHRKKLILAWKMPYASPLSFLSL